MKHKVLLGIEHLMTGVMVRSAGNDVLVFERESASVVRVTSGTAIEVYWPVNQVWIKSEEIPEPAQATKYSHGEAEWYAQVVGSEMAVLDGIAHQQYRNHNAKHFDDKDIRPLPEAVIKAMRRKHGKDANKYIRELTWSMGGYWAYQCDGMYLGVEPDGYIHS